MGWFVTSKIRDGGKGFKVSDFIFLSVCLVGIIYAIHSNIFDVFEQMKLYSRITGHSRSTTISDQTRIYLYRLGWDAFLNSPFIGVGFNNLPSYTHTTYLEVLGGTGFLGTIIFYFPFVRLFLFCIKRIKSTQQEEIKKLYSKKITIIIVLLAMMLFRAVHYYIIPIVIIAIVFYEDGSEKYPFTHRKQLVVSIRR